MITTGNDTGKIGYNADNSTTWTAVTAWPLTLTTSATTGAGTELIVTMSSDLTINSTNGGLNGYFKIGKDYTTFEGNNKKVIVDGVTDYEGLIQNGTNGANGKNYVTIQNLGVVTANGSTLGFYKGWIGQDYFGRGASNNVANNCYSTGNISGDYSGGIFGRFASNTGNISANNCYSTGGISGDGSGGIFSGEAGYSGNVSATNCYSTGAITGQYSGGIFGLGAGFSGTASATNCYSTGDISIGILSGGIFGAYAGNSGNASATNCYFNGMSDQIKGSGTVTVTNCYGYSGSWFDSTANSTLVSSGLPSSNPGIGTTWTSIVANTPYLLSSFNAENYNPNSVTNPTLTGGNYTSPAGIFLNTDGYNYSLINVVPITTSSINITTGAITFNGISVGSYDASVVSYQNVNGNKVGYNISHFSISIIQPLISIPPVFNIGVPPTIDLPQSYLESQTIPIGDSTYFEVTVDEPKEMKYQWFFYSYKLNKQILLVGETSPLLLLDNLTEDDEGDYFVLITNKYTGASLISPTAILLVIQPTLNLHDEMIVNENILNLLDNNDLLME